MVYRVLTLQNITCYSVYTDPGSVHNLGRSPGEGNGNLLQYSCLENSMDKGAWQVTVDGLQGVGQDGATITHML